MPPFRLLALDVDGTLVNSDHELTAGTRDALREAIAAGIKVVLATGRRYSRVLPFVEPLGLAVPIVTASGALIKDPAEHRTLFKAAFAPGVLEQVLGLLAAEGLEPILYADTFAEGFDYYCLRTDVPCPLLGEFLSVNAGSERLWPGLPSIPPAGVFAGFAMGPQAQMLDLERRLAIVLGEHLYVHVLRSPRYQGYMCEIAPVGITKWSGVARLARQWNIQPYEICAVGDDVNDIPMLEAAGLGVAMGNALEVVKRAAHRVAPAHDDDGLVEVVRWLLRG